MSKIEIAIYDDGKLIKKMPCKSYLLAVNQDEKDIAVDVFLRNDIDTMRIVSSCITGGIDIITQTGKMAGMTDKENKERINMILEEILRMAFDMEQANNTREEEEHTDGFQ